MNKKGFTLIELLAVIVILAIIALIATPIILGIINDAREKAKVRSSELVYTGVEYAYTTSLYQLENAGEEVSLKSIWKNFNVENVNKGNEPANTATSFLVTTSEGVSCRIIKKLSGYQVKCGDNTASGETKYLDKLVQTTSQEANFKPQVYKILAQNEELYLGSSLTNAVSNPSSLNSNIYLGFDLDTNGKTTKGYVCFVKDGKEYCVKAESGRETFEKNIEILKQVFDSCIFQEGEGEYSDEEFSCNDGSLGASVDRIYGKAYASYGNKSCFKMSGGAFSCNNG